jgi:hypothetical protein
LGQLVGRPAPKQRGDHHPKGVSEPFHWGLQTPLDRGRQGLRQSPVEQRLFQGLQEALRLPRLLLQPRAVLPEAALLGVVLTSWRSGHGGQGLLLSFGVVCVEETMA